MTTHLHIGVILFRTAGIHDPGVLSATILPQWGETMKTVPTRVAAVKTENTKEWNEKYCVLASYEDIPYTKFQCYTPTTLSEVKMKLIVSLSESILIL